MMDISRQPHPLALRDAISDEAAAWLTQRLGRQANLCADSRRIAAGDAFFARGGQRFSADQHIASAVQAGAAAVLLEADDALAAVEEISGPVPTLRVPLLARRMGMIASAFYGRPSMTMQIIAVTGTNGKSTVTAALGHALARCGISTAVIGTLGVGIFPADCDAGFEPSWDDQATGGLTSPDAVDLQRLLRDLRSKNITVVALEASSVGLVQGRLSGCAIKAAAFTNLSHDHLDIHGTMERYAQAKALLFSCPSLGTMVVNTDDAYAPLMWQATDLHIQRIAVGRHWPENAQVGIRADGEQATIDGWQFQIYGTGKAVDLAGPLRLPVAGRHNIHNALIVAGCMLAMGIDSEKIRRELSQFRLPAGRCQMLVHATGPWACVDYAHSPDALTRILEALRPIAEARTGRLVCVFGCGGDRDPAKRPMMGEVAAREADRVVLTSDNPRRESAQKILQEILAGVPERLRDKVQSQPDRAAAIMMAIHEAKASDVVLIAGKGHERFQVIADQTIPFSDVEHAIRAQETWQPSHQPQPAHGEAHA